MASTRGHRPTHAVARSLSVLFWLAVAIGGPGETASGAEASTNRLAPVYWQQRLFFIPYSANPRDPLIGAIAKVQLLESRSGAGDWRPLQDAKPNVRGFSYHAPEDGEYWFALAHFDRRGQPWPNTATRAQIRIIVDTVKPELQLSGELDVAGSIVVRYEARDENLSPKSLLIEARSTGEEWTAVAAGPADVVHRDRLVGRANWQPSKDVGTVEIRASIADHAGHRAEAGTEVTVTGPSLRMPDKYDPASSGLRDRTANAERNSVETDPFRITPQLPARNWPVDNRLPAVVRRGAKRHDLFAAPPEVEVGAPPASNPYSTAAHRDLPLRTPANLVRDGRSAATTPQTHALEITPLTGERIPQGQSISSDQGWTQANRSTNGETRVVNSRTFDVEYDLQSVGPWGVSKVELWGTHDGGRTWQSYGVDDDNRSPIRVTVAGAGTFGFRILVDGADGANAPPPRPGEEPELVIAVDLQPPTVQRLETDLSQRDSADYLRLRWSVADTNLDPRPISLAYSSSPAGPWSTITAGMENTGEYEWRIERHVPGRFYVRLEARDTAGNIATYQTPSPISLPRPQPTGRLRGVRPVTDASEKNRVSRIELGR